LDVITLHTVLFQPPQFCCHHWHPFSWLSFAAYARGGCIYEDRFADIESIARNIRFSLSLAVVEPVKVPLMCSISYLIFPDV
jgi:hypothetical protein